eukprot:TRINITY_DN1367_c3_g1_i1.p1 TRINITY_DN1367_c3_g1~~TRINITY_DN1367_c3_g1_i1.p1  ORF type:complete len:384 (+),score=86.24 TRINITY_DN1367_c3_g1_i1:44-1153(+)
MLQTQKAPEEKKKGGFLSKLMKKVDGCDISLQFKNRSEKDMISVDDRTDLTTQKMHMFDSEDPVEGVLELRPSGRLTHQGITLEFIGLIVTNTDKEQRNEFVRQEQKIQPEGGALSSTTPIKFSFDAVKNYESYRGICAKVQYFIRLRIKRSMLDIKFEEEVWVSKIESQYQDMKDRSEDKPYEREANMQKGVGMEVGVDDVLHIEFKYEKKIFHCKETIIGQVGFKVAKLDLQCGEVSIVKREYIGGTNQFETETLQKFEIMDGLPVPGEVVPIRLYLNCIPRLTPTYISINGTFSVKYFVNLVLVTADCKRYFKQQEVTIYRRHGQEAPTPMVIDIETLQRSKAAAEKARKHRKDKAANAEAEEASN